MTLIILLLLSIVSSSFAEIWNVYVYTGTKRFAGTDSNVYITLFNEEGDSTSDIQLTHYNWQPENADFPIRNLFEAGARERFRIQTESIRSVTKIQIRLGNFISLEPAWLLDKIILERNRDGAKYTFPCDCWLREANPYIKIPVLPDQQTMDKNKNKDSSSKNNRAFVIILLALIILIILIFGCFNQYRRQQRRRSLSLRDTIEQTHQEPPLLEGEPSSGLHLWVKTRRRWRNFRSGLPSYNHARTIQNTTNAPTTSTVIPSEQPPSYEDLFPNTTTPINSLSSSHV